jgi:hypothetical protein
MNREQITSLDWTGGLRTRQFRFLKSVLVLTQMCQMSNKFLLTALPEKA